MESIELKKEPPWKNAVEKIREKFEQDGYGCLVTDDDFLGYLSISNPINCKNWHDARKIQLEMLQMYKSIDVLLDDYNICLMRSPGNNGFEILAPKDQISRGYDKKMAKLRKELNKIQRVLVNVNHEVLSLEEERERQLKIVKTGFIKSAANKRRLELPSKEMKMIEGNR